MPLCFLAFHFLLLPCQTSLVSCQRKTRRREPCSSPTPSFLEIGRPVAASKTWVSIFPSFLGNCMWAHVKNSPRSRSCEGSPGWCLKLAAAVVFLNRRSENRPSRVQSFCLEVWTTKSVLQIFKVVTTDGVLKVATHLWPNWIYRKRPSEKTNVLRRWRSCPQNQILRKNLKLRVFEV